MFANTIKLMLPSKRSVSVRDKGFGSQLMLKANN